MVRRSLLLVPLLMAVIACDSDPGPVPGPNPPAGLAVSYATPTCAPWDGPAVQLYLTGDSSAVLPPPADRVEIAIWRAASTLGGTTVTWGESSQDGWAGWCPAGGACQVASSTTVRFQRTGRDTVLAGSVDLRFPDGRVVTGGFRAEWRRIAAMCG